MESLHTEFALEAQRMLAQGGIVLWSILILGSVMFGMLARAWWRLFGFERRNDASD